LEHPYLYLLHNPSDEPTADTHFSLYDFDFERTAAARVNYRKLIYDEIKLYHFPEAKTEYDEQIQFRLSLVESGIYYN
jgi:mitogen-activated protein kinase 1/3